MRTTLYRNLKPLPTILLFLLISLFNSAHTNHEPNKKGKQNRASQYIRTNFALDFYVSPTGLPTGDGSLANPWDLQTALNQPAAIVAGSNICLQPGTYHGNFESNLRGTSANPIIVKNCSGGRVVIDGSRAGQVLKNVTTFVINGAFTWFWGFEVTNSDPERILTQSGSNPPERRGAGIAVFAEGIKLINLLVYDNGEGIDAWTPAVDCEVNGCVVFNNGWYAPDREHGHGIYTQNNTGTKQFIDNIVLNNFSYAWQVYGSAAATLKNYYIEGNTVFNDRWLVGGAAPMENVEMVSNYTYRDTLQIGYFSNVLNSHLVLRDNFFASLLKIYYWNDVTATSNTFFTGSTYNYPVLFDFEGVPDFSSFHFDRNTYYWSTPPPASQSQPALAWENNTLPGDDPAQQGLYFLPQWKAMGQDVNSTLRLWPAKDAANMALSGAQVFLRKNKYDGRRATVTIYNWDQSDLVLANVSTILSPGDHYELHNVQNYFGDVIRGVFDGGLLNIPMINHTVAKPFGYDIEQGPNTFKEFGSFLLLNTGAAAGPLPVKFLSFDVMPETKTVKLKWNTAEEQRVKYYVIERSTDAVHYDSIGAMKSSTIQLAKHEYAFTDKLPAQGKNYYRIKEVDLDSRIMYTSVKNVEFKFKGFDFIIVQNPANDEIKLRMRIPLPLKMKMVISNNSGQLLMNQVKQFAAGDINDAIPIAKLPKGSYFLSMSSGDEMITRAFIKQ